MPSGNQIWPPPALAAQIARLSAIAGGFVGVAAEHLESGRRFAQNGETPFPMASTFKIAVAGAVLQRIDEGRLMIGQMIAITDDARVDSDVIAAKLPHTGVALSIHNLIEVMLTQSDNTASDVLMDVAGGAEAVTAWLRGIGIAGQRIDRDTAALTRDFFGLPPGPVFQALRKALTDQPGLDAKADLPNPPFDDDPRDTSTPNAMLQLLAAIHRGGALSPGGTKTLLDVLERCATGETRLKGLLPLKTAVAHKTGTIGGIANDVGIVTLPDGSHFAIAVFVTKSTEPPAQRERVIAEIARTLYDAYLLT